MNSIPILYENDELLVINKPSGLAVQGGEGITHSLDKDFSLQLGYKIYLVHRLDKDTAGLMIVAKSAAAASKWTKLISSKIVKKEYVAVCSGNIKEKTGVIEESVVQHGVEKKARTSYSVEKKSVFHFEDSDLSLWWLRLCLDTGRMHQIRIHLAKKNCPIAGDEQHGDFKLNKFLKKNLGIKKLLLASVKLTLPIDGKNHVFEIELPLYMQESYLQSFVKNE